MLAKAERISQKSVMTKRRFDDQFRFNLRSRDKKVFERVASLLDMDLAEWMRKRLRVVANADLISLGKPPVSFVDDVDEEVPDAVDPGDIPTKRPGQKAL